MSGEPTLFVVDDDQAIREALETLLESVGYRVECHASSQSFLDGYHPGRSGCLILDIRMPEMTGLELQGQLERRGIGLPVIIITGHGDVPAAVRALQAGAIDFLQKPFRDEQLLRAVRQALQTDSERRRVQAARARIATRLATLTEREREILEWLCEGKSNKEMAAQLAVSLRTVETHRMALMEKLEAKNLAELIRIALAAGIVVNTHLPT